MSHLRRALLLAAVAIGGISLLAPLAAPLRRAGATLTRPST